MPAANFPNATLTKFSELMDLCDQLIPVFDPAVEGDRDFIIATNGCAVIEEVLAIPTLARYHQLDPALLQKIHALLNSCR